MVRMHLELEILTDRVHMRSNPAWHGKGPCYNSHHYRGTAHCKPPIPASSCGVNPPLIAYMVVGQPRGFLGEAGYMLFQARVVDSMAAHSNSRVFLHLKMGNDSSQWQQLNDAATLLRPAKVTTPLEEDIGSAVYADEHRRAVRNTSLRTISPSHPECFWKDERPHYPLSQARVWWSTMANAWAAVVTYERTEAMIFDAVVFTRPDVYLDRGMGPWCAYAFDQAEGAWYSPSGTLTPDMFWIMSRSAAQAVLSTWPRVIVPCEPKQACCDFMLAEPPHGRVPYSLWLREYWRRVGGFVLNHTLQGTGRVGASPKKAGRNCTLHLGCLLKEL